MLQEAVSPSEPRTQGRGAGKCPDWLHSLSLQKQVSSACTLLPVGRCPVQCMLPRALRF